MCTTAVSGLAHLLEREGLATVLIGLVPQHVKAIRPPRALLVPFPFGRPLGEPNNPSVQHQVLGECLRLLDAPGPAPVIESLDVVPANPQPEETGWACPVSFPASGSDHTPGTETLPQDSQPILQRVLREVSLLTPWFERGREARGRSAGRVSGLTIDDAVRWLCTLRTGERQRPDAGQSLGLTFKLAVEDVKTFYLEAATAQPGASAGDLSSWFWQQTAAAELLWDLRQRLKGDEADDELRLYAGLTTVPTEEVERRQRG